MPPPEDDQARTPGSTPVSPEEQMTLSASERLSGTPLPQVGGHTFSANEVVAGRFKIVRFLGQGGMGEVYEAEDLELHEHVALKTIRPEIASDERTIARFKQEIQLARKVTHRNVCRIFDLFHDRKEPGGEVTFLTMELLRGETLAERLRQEGRMTTAEALPIVEQMAAPLQRGSSPPSPKCSPANSLSGRRSERFPGKMSRV